jgi:hypothetical protein
MMLFAILWFILTWVGGTFAILGSLMAVASVLFWLMPANSGRWFDQLKVTGFSVGIAIVGFVLLYIAPFPAIAL